MVYNEEKKKEYAMKKLFIFLLVLAILACGCNLNGSAGSTSDVDWPTGPIPVETTPTGPAATEPTNPRPTDPPPTGPAPVDPEECTAHKDGNDDGYCDDCHTYLIIYIDNRKHQSLHRNNTHSRLHL